MIKIWSILPGQLDLKSFFVLWSRSNPFGVLRKRINPPHSDPIQANQSVSNSIQSNPIKIQPNLRCGFRGGPGNFSELQKDTPEPL